jgi:hypothetical protein
MNDAPADIGIKENFSDPVHPVLGVPLPVFGLVAFFDEQWSEKFSSSIGYSMVSIDNSNGQDPSAFHSGNYACANFLFYPTANAMMGVELQYGDRKNFNDDFSPNIDDYSPKIFKVQFSFKYKFSQIFYRKSNS